MCLWWYEKRNLKEPSSYSRRPPFLICLINNKVQNNFIKNIFRYKYIFAVYQYNIVHNSSKKLLGVLTLHKITWILVFPENYSFLFTLISSLLFCGILWKYLTGNNFSLFVISSHRDPWFIYILRMKWMKSKRINRYIIPKSCFKLTNP